MNDFTVTDTQRRFFDDLLEDTLQSLPLEVHQQLETLPIIVEDELSDAMRNDLNLADDEDLLGLHWGTSLEEQFEADPYPNQVFLFRGPIIRFAMHNVEQAASHDNANAYNAELARQVRITLLHEIGHHYGLDEDDLDALGYA